MLCTRGVSSVSRGCSGLPALEGVSPGLGGTIMRPSLGSGPMLLSTVAWNKLLHLLGLTVPICKMELLMLAWF